MRYLVAVLALAGLLVSCFALREHFRTGAVAVQHQRTLGLRRGQPQPVCRDRRRSGGGLWHSGLCGDRRLCPGAALVDRAAADHRRRRLLHLSRPTSRRESWRPTASGASPLRESLRSPRLQPLWRWCEAGSSARHAIAGRLHSGPGVAMSLLAEFVKQAALDEGFSLAGIAPAAPLGELDYFPAWIEAGYHGEMEYLAQDQRCRRAAAGGACKRRSVGALGGGLRRKLQLGRALLHAVRRPGSGDGFRAMPLSTPTITSCCWRACAASSSAWWSASWTDRLHANAPRTWCYVDTGPVVERVLAAHSGIGWTGKNGCILNQQLGSWLFLGVILSSHRAAARSARRRPLRLLHALPRRLSHPGFHCAAPTRRRPAASPISPSSSADAAPEELREKMGRHLFGCDICQDVCPWNRRAPASPDPAFAPRTELVNPSLEWISGMNDGGVPAHLSRVASEARETSADCCATPPLPWATAETENICRACASWRGMQTRRSPNMRAGRLQDWRRQPMPTPLGSQSSIYASRFFSRRRLDLRARLVAQRPTGERIVVAGAHASMFHAAARE